MASGFGSSEVQTPAIYASKLQSRCLAAHGASSESHRFLVGTTSLRDSNQIHIVEYDEDTNSVQCIRQYAHKNELWVMAPHPTDAGLIATGYNDGASFKASLWRMADSDTKDDDAGSVDAPLDLVSALPKIKGKVQSLFWKPMDEDSDKGSELIMCDAESIRHVKIDPSGKPTVAGECKSDSTDSPGRGAWDPFHEKNISCGAGGGIVSFDLRSYKPVLSINDAHPPCVRSVGYSPNKPWHLVSGGDDCTVKFWDLRSAKDPVKVLAGHTHWVWSVAYNPWHDQLVLSGSTDTTTALWRVSSVSAAPILVDEEDEEESVRVDALVHRYDVHEDSVYAVAWSACSAWVFASLSYSGRLVVDSVPVAEKYNILL